MEIEKKLELMGLSLPEWEPPIANYVSSVRTGNLLFVAGHVGDTTDALGQLGKDVTIEEGYEAARKTALACLSTIKHAIGDLDKVRRFVKLLCMVNSAPDFTDQPSVANGCSDLLVELYGDRGRHAR
ncbi:MAG: RidA family protein, partial [Dehalococcoidia bacterium]